MCCLFVCLYTPRSVRGTLVLGPHHGQCELLLNRGSGLHFTPSQRKRTYLGWIYPRPVSRTLIRHFCIRWRLSDQSDSTPSAFKRWIIKAALRFSALAGPSFLHVAATLLRLTDLGSCTRLQRRGLLTWVSPHLLDWSYLDSVWCPAS